MRSAVLLLLLLPGFAHADLFVYLNKCDLSTYVKLLYVDSDKKRVDMFDSVKGKFNNHTSWEIEGKSNGMLRLASTNSPARLVIKSNSTEYREIERITFRGGTHG